MEEKIIEIANVLLKRNFMLYTDQEPITTLTDALVLIVMEASEEQNFELELEDVYNHINQHIVSGGEALDEGVPAPAFRELDAEDVVEFKKWARDSYTLYSPISDMWHSVTRKECEKMNEEADLYSEKVQEQKWGKK